MCEDGVWWENLHKWGNFGLFLTSSHIPGHVKILISWLDEELLFRLTMLQDQCVSAPRLSLGDHWRHLSHHTLGLYTKQTLIFLDTKDKIPLFWSVSGSHFNFQCNVLFLIVPIPSLQCSFSHLPPLARNNKSIMVWIEVNNTILRQLRGQYINDGLRIPCE